MRQIIFGSLLLLGFFTALCISESGEILEVMVGEVNKCEILGGGNIEGMSHATIKAENGSYIISSLRNCKPGKRTKIYVKRGALYFNTVYATE
jgi:hypothetical protein